MEYIIMAVVLFVFWDEAKVMYKSGTRLAHNRARLTASEWEIKALEDEVQLKEKRAELLAKKAALLNELEK